MDLWHAVDGGVAPGEGWGLAAQDAEGIDVLLAQLAPVHHDVTANTKTVTDLLGAHPEVDLAVLPEMFLHGYALKGVKDIAVELSSEPVDAIRSAAHAAATAVIVGLAERVGDTMANTALCIDATGKLAGVYRKVHLFGAEARYFTPGDSYVTANVAGCTVGPLICFDIEFPEPCRALADAGIDLLVSIAANMAPYEIEHDLCLRVRAMENRVPHVYVNGVGNDAGLDFLGCSGVADARGALLSGLPTGSAEIRTVRVPIGDRPYPDYLAERRRDIPVVASDPSPW